MLSSSAARRLVAVAHLQGPGNQVRLDLAQPIVERDRRSVRRRRARRRPAPDRVARAEQDAGGEAAGPHRAAGAGLHDPLAGVLELAHVARPAIAREGVAHRGRDRRRVDAALRREAAEEEVGQQRDVFLALAQRRQHDRQHVEAVEQVLAEVPLRDHLLEVAFRAGDDADVDVDRARPADPLDGAVLDRAQQLDLHRQRHVVDVVEEQRAALRHLEAARLVLDRAGEGAALVPEQLGLDQVLGKQRAADRDERLVAAAARMVQQVGDDFLARPALAGDDHAAVAAAHHLDEVEDRAHARAVADDDVVR